MNKITRFRDIPQFTEDGNWQADFELDFFVKFIEGEVTEQGLQLCPDFQRGHIWSEEQQIAWLEFFFRGGKSGNVIYLNNPAWQWHVPSGAYDDYVVVDGLQRITAIQRFINNETRVFGSYYKEYTDRLLLKHSIKVNVNNLKTKREVLQWYIDMNSGGTPHSIEEIERVKELIINC